MHISLSRWRPGHLLAACSAYWLGLAAVTLTPTIAAIVRATSAGPDKSSVSATLGNTLLRVTVTEAGTQTFAASAHLLSAALLIAVPPLALYGLWLLTRRRTGAPSVRAAAPPALGDGKPDFDVPQQANVQSRAPHA